MRKQRLRKVDGLSQAHDTWKRQQQGCKASLWIPPTSLTPCLYLILYYVIYPLFLPLCAFMYFTFTFHLISHHCSCCYYTLKKSHKNLTRTMDKWTVLYNRLWIFMSFPPWITCLSFYEWVFISATWYPALAYCCSLIDVRGKNSAPCCPSSVLTSKLEFSSLAEQSLTSWAISGWTRTEPSLILLGDLGRLMKPSWASRFGQHLGPWFHVVAGSWLQRKRVCLALGPSFHDGN